MVRKEIFSYYFKAIQLQFTLAYRFVFLFNDTDHKCFVSVKFLDTSVVSGQCYCTRDKCKCDTVIRNSSSPALTMTLVEISLLPVLNDTRGAMLIWKHFHHWFCGHGRRNFTWGIKVANIFTNFEKSKNTKFRLTDVHGILIYECSCHCPFNRNSLFQSKK